MREILLQMYEKLWEADKDKFVWNTILKDTLEKMEGVEDIIDSENSGLSVEQRRQEIQNLKNSNEQSLAIPTLNGNVCFAKNSFALVEHKNNDTDEIEYGDVVGETKGYFLVKPHLRKEQNRWLKVDCNIVEYYR